MTDWHTELERELIRDRGGTPTRSYGADGTLADGDPVEVRLARVEDRFRVGRETHDQLLEDGGAYIFDDVTDDQPPRQVSADKIDSLLERDWHTDRGYEHQFVEVDEIF